MAGPVKTFSLQSGGTGNVGVNVSTVSSVQAEPGGGTKINFNTSDVSGNVMSVTVSGTVAATIANLNT